MKEREKDIAEAGLPTAAPGPVWEAGVMMLYLLTPPPYSKLIDHFFINSSIHQLIDQLMKLIDQIIN